MNFSNSSGGGDCFSFQVASCLDQARYKLMEEEESHRRQQRNQDLRAKIQELKLRSLLEASRSETLRQMQMEHKALVQKYLGDQNLPISTFPGDHHVQQQGMMDSDLTRKAPPRPNFVSTGINTELTGPVMRMPIGADTNSGNEIPSWNAKQKVLPEMNVNQSSPPTTTLPSASAGAEMELPIPLLSSFEYNKVIGDEGKETFTASKIKFLREATTSDSEVTTTTGEGSQHAGRRFSASHVTTAALKKFLTDETSDSNPTTSLSTFSRRKSLPGTLPGIPNLRPPVGYLPPTARATSKNLGDIYGGKQEGKNMQQDLMVEDEGDGRSESETTTIGESILDPPPPPQKTTESSEHGRLPGKEQVKTQKAENKSNLGINDRTGNNYGGESGNNSNNSSIRSSSSTSAGMQNPIKIGDGAESAKMKARDIKDGEAFGETAAEDKSFLNTFKNSGESATRQDKVGEEKDKGEEEPKHNLQHPFKLKLGNYEDSESEKSEIEFRDSAKSTAGTGAAGKVERTEKAEEKAKNVDDDDDLDDFFDL